MHNWIKISSGWLTVLLILWGFFYLASPGIVIDPNGRRILAALFASVIAGFAFVVKWLVFPKLKSFSLASQLWIKSFLFASAALTGFLVVMLTQLQFFLPKELVSSALSYRFFHLLSMLFSAPFSTSNWSEALPVGFISQFSAFLVLLMLIAVSGMIIAVIDTRWRAMQTEKQLQVQRLKMLEMQMQPHFLFNTLNAISSLVQSDPPRAEQLLISLSDFLRYNFKSGQERQIPLADEWEFTRQYLQLMQARHGQKLHWQMEDSPACPESPVPPLSLQPLVENGIKYTLEQTESVAQIKVTSQASGDYCVVEVEDNGAGFSKLNEPAFPPVGHALSHLIQRLQLLYGPKAVLEFSNPVTGGARVQMRVPLASFAS